VTDKLDAVQCGNVKVLWSSLWSSANLYKSFLSARVSHCHRCCRRHFCKSLW